MPDLEVFFAHMLSDMLCTFCAFLHKELSFGV